MKTLADASRKTITALAGKGWRDGLTLLEQWAEIAGPNIARLCSPQQVRFPNNDKRDGTLVLAAPNAARLELQHQTPYILRRVNQFFGYAAIATVQLVPGDLPKTATPAAEEAAEELSLEQALQNLGSRINQ